MWCADCESIETFIFDRTALWIYVPTEDCFGKVVALCGASGYQAEQFSPHGVKVTLHRATLSHFLTELYGATNGQERRGAKIVSTDGVEPDIASLGRVVDLEVFINRFKSQWIIDSIENKTYESWFQPIVHANSSPEAPEAFGNEALFRMRDEHGSMMPPDLVFKMAAHSNLLFSLDLVV